MTSGLAYGHAEGGCYAGTHVEEELLVCMALPASNLGGEVDDSGVGDD